MMNARFDPLIRGWHRTSTVTYYPVIHKYSLTEMAWVGETREEDADVAIASASEAFEVPYAVSARARVLEIAADLLANEADRFARLIAQEAGKPLKDARGEVARSVLTLRYSAVVARTLHGSEVPVRGVPGSENRTAFTLRKPYGVVLAITPFNFPLNLVLHKVGPALAVGNSVILKPSPLTPLTALALGDLLARAGLPSGRLSVLTGQRAELGDYLVHHSGIHAISFTGSVLIGQRIRSAAGLKPVMLELGNNSANIVHRDADVIAAATGLAQKGFGFAGQMCVSVQRIYVHKDVHNAFLRALTAAARQLKIGNPEDEDTDVGPLISVASADRLREWYDEALTGGASAEVIPTWDRNFMTPGILSEVDPSMRVMTEEVFGPLVSVTSYDNFDDVLSQINAGHYGLQAGVFTKDIDLALRAAETLQVGGGDY